MKYMYTTQPDEGCREIEVGIYGRPVHTTDQLALKRRGWSYSVDDLRGNSHVREAEEEGREEEDQKVARGELEALYKEQFGKFPHHKMKDQTIIEKLKASADD